MHRTSAVTLALSGLLLLPACDGRGGGGEPGENGSGARVTELSIDKVALYQGSEARFMKDQEEDTPDVPIVAGRDGMMRVFVFTHSDWEDREVEAVLTLYTMEQDEDDWVVGSSKRFSETMDVVISSSDSSKSSTFNFDIPGDELEAGNMAYRVDLYESGNDAGPGGEKSPHWPEPGDDPQEFQPRSSGEQLKIVFIPLEYRADGSGRLPDTSDRQMEMLHDAFMAQYPTREVDIDVEDPVAWSNAINANGSGFDRVLEYLYNIRDRYDYDVYLYALHAPAPSYGDFCQGGCVAGLSSLAQQPSDSWARVSTGLGFSGDQTSGTTVHEVGHAHGRQHTPCGTNGDNNYPHSGGMIGAWGYDIIEKTLKSPNTFADFMGYCDPTWVSDYTFDALFDRVRSVNNGRSLERIEDMPIYRTLMITVDGALEWTKSVRLPGLNEGSVEKTIELLNEAGDVMDTVTGRLNPFSHLSGGFLHIPDFDGAVASVRVVDHGTIAVSE
jgi:hypothetical protein